MITFGRTSSGSVTPLLLDASGNVIVSASQLTTTGGKIHIDANGNVITSADQLTTTGGKIHIDANGDPVISFTNYYRNAYDSIFESINNLSLPAGSSSQVGSAVPANQAYIWRNCSFQYTGTVAGVHLRCMVLRSAGIYIINNTETVVSTQFYGFALEVPLIAGDQVGVRVVGATLNDDLIVNNVFERIH